MAKKAAKKRSAPITSARGRAKKPTTKATSAPVTKARRKPSAAAGISTLVRGTIAGTVTSVSRAMGRGNRTLDAIELLEQEHREFEAILEQGEKSTERARTGRRELLDRLTARLNAHERMEEKVLYPALQSHPQAREIVLEGYEEHHVADLIIAELRQVATDDEAWGAKFKVLKENIEHHIEEEEGEMFRLARGIFSRDELLELAERMRAVRPG